MIYRLGKKQKARFNLPEWWFGAAHDELPFQFDIDSSHWDTQDHVAIHLNGYSVPYDEAADYVNNDIAVWVQRSWLIPGGDYRKVFDAL